MEKGDIYRIHPYPASYSRQEIRLGVIVQSNALLKLSTVLIAPISQNAQCSSFRPKITIKGETAHILIDQIWPIEVSRFGQLVAQLSPEENWAIEEALKIVLDL